MEYNTHQRTTIVEFLKENSNRAFSIEEIAEKIPVAKSTVYRLMPKLLCDGTIKRFTNKAGRGSLYQHMACDGCSHHFHLKCTLCGKILHMKSSASDRLSASIKNASNFSVDKSQTVLLGICSDCGRLG